MCWQNLYKTTQMSKRAFNLLLRSYQSFQGLPGNLLPRSLGSSFWKSGLPEVPLFLGAPLCHPGGQKAGFPKFRHTFYSTKLDIHIMAFLLKSFYKNPISIFSFIYYCFSEIGFTNMNLKTYLNFTTAVTRSPKYLDSITSQCKSFLLIHDEELKWSL